MIIIHRAAKEVAKKEEEEDIGDLCARARNGRLDAD